MNFTFLFAAIAALTFKVQFSVDDNSRQDYFLFQGDDQSAHLHRQNQTLYLHLIQGNDVEVYEMSLQIAGTNFYFSWLNYMVDEDPTMLVKKESAASFRWNFTTSRSFLRCMMLLMIITVILKHTTTSKKSTIGLLQV